MEASKAEDPLWIAQISYGDGRTVIVMGDESDPILEVISLADEAPRRLL